MKVALSFILMIGCTVVANLLLKSGAGAAAEDRVFFGLMGWRSLAGLCVFGAAGLIYSWILRWMPLNIAQSFAALQFVAVILASSFVLSESIPVGRWVGILLISAGILLVSMTYTRA